MIATDSTQRTIQGIAAPSSLSALMTAESDRQGSAHWAMASGTANAVLLQEAVPSSAYADGLLIRFVAIGENTGQVSVDLSNLGTRQVLDPDRRPVAMGAIKAGSVVQIEYQDSCFILHPAPAEVCPSGFIQANDEFCMQVDGSPPSTWFAAANDCFDRGARLCTWDEYLFACTALTSQLNGLFDNWEWIDDTSDHTHTADQAGRWTCISQRSIGATQTDLGNSRCCYRLR